MALVRRDDSRYWWISIYRGPKLPRIQKSSGNEDYAKAEAMERVLRLGLTQNAHRDKLVAALDGIIGHVEDHGLTFEAAYQVYVSDGGSKERHVPSALKKLTEWMAVHHPKIETVQAVSRGIAFAFADDLRPTMSAKSWNNVRGNLRAVWEASLRRVGSGVNIWAAVPSSSTHDSNHGRPFTDREIIAILKSCQAGVVTGEWYHASIMALYTGLRQGDIPDLKWADVKNKTLRLVPSKTKRHALAVTIPLHNAVVTALTDLPRTTEWLFPIIRKNQRSSATRTDFAKILEHAKIDRSAHVTFHCWRHTWRSRLAAAGVPADVARRMGAAVQGIDEKSYNQDEVSLKRGVKALPPLPKPRSSKSSKAGASESTVGSGAKAKAKVEIASPPAALILKDFGIEVCDRGHYRCSSINGLRLPPRIVCVAEWWGSFISALFSSP